MKNRALQFCSWLPNLKPVKNKKPKRPPPHKTHLPYPHLNQEISTQPGSSPKPLMLGSLYLRNTKPDMIMSLP